MTILTEVLHAGGFIVSEEENFYSRDQITITNTTPLVAGTVISKIGVPANEAVSVAAAAGNVGTGTLTLDATAPIAAGAIDGIYELVLQTGASATAQFELSDPNGIVVGEGAVGTTFNNQLKFLLADGGTHFAVGDRFLITVARPDGVADLWGALDDTQTNGQQIAAGVLFAGWSVAGSGTQQAVAVVRQAQVRASDLTWPSGFTSAQIAEATHQLRLKGVIAR